MSTISSGYSGTPLAKKLGIASGHRVKTRGAPANYETLLAPLPDDVTISRRLRGEADIWHLFVTTKKGLARGLRDSMAETTARGIIWVSWPKKTSGVATELTEDRIREAALPLGLVDVKVCAVDETWSGLKLLRRKAPPKKP